MCVPICNKLWFSVLCWELGAFVKNPTNFLILHSLFQIFSYICSINSCNYFKMYSYRTENKDVKSATKCLLLSCNLLSISILPPPPCWLNFQRHYKSCATMLKLRAFAYVVHIVPRTYCCLCCLI